MTTSRTSSIAFLVLACLQALAPVPSSALSFSSIFGKDADSSNGSSSGTATDSVHQDKLNMQVQQPLLEVTDWFLTKKEITDSRGGVPRSDMVTYSTGNAVTTFTASNDFFNSAYDDLTSTKEGDRVMIAAWGSALIPMKPDVDPTGSKTRFDKVMAGVVERGGNVSILGWANIKLRTQMINVRKTINEIAVSPTNGAKAVMILDDRLPKTLSSHHQKTLVIAASSSSDSTEQPVAYIGGVDFIRDRWDTMYHNVSAIRDAANMSVSYKGWCDGHFRIHGPAAKDIATNFLTRWNSEYLPVEGLDDDLLDYENPPYDNLPLLDYSSSNSASSLGKHNVQIVRTFSCKYKHYEFAPHGENSLFKARLKAIKNAKNFIYIEDQYFILVPELLDALMEVLPTIQRLIVVTNAQTKIVSTGGYKKYSYEMVTPLLKAFPDKFNLYTTQKERNIYVHSKIFIVDDVYLSVGSANWNRRSMTSDSEIAANVIDDTTVESPDGVTVKKIARDFRIRKFQEMTGLGYEELDAMTFIESANKFEAAAKTSDKKSIVQHLDVNYQAYFLAVTDAIRKVSDPQDTCSSD